MSSTPDVTYPTLSGLANVRPLCQTRGMNKNEPQYMVAVDSFLGMERQYFNSYLLAYNEYMRLVRFGRHAWLYNLTTLVRSN